MNENVEALKRVVKQGMIDNFTKDGFLTPVFFWLENNVPQITQIPAQYLNGVEGKLVLGQVIKNKCADDKVSAAGIIIEAYGLKINLDKDIETANKLLSGEMKVSETENKQDIIVLIFSTPEEHDVISYAVDCENKRVLDEFTGIDGADAGGIFNNFFVWKKN